MFSGTGVERLGSVGPGQLGVNCHGKGGRIKGEVAFRKSFQRLQCPSHIWSLTIAAAAQ